MKLLICIFLLIASQAMADQACPRLQEYDAVAAKVAEKFYDRKFRGLDWNARVLHYREQIDCSGNQNAVAAVANKLLSELNASHTALYTTDDLDYWALQSIFSRNMTDFAVAFSGIWPERRNGHWYAKYVLPASPAHAAGVLSGDKLISIDGRAFHPLGFAAQRISTLMISSDGQKRRRIRIHPETKSVQQFMLDASQSSSVVISAGAKRVGYFHLWSGTHELFLQSLDMALSNFEDQQVDALIVDLRGGFGGASLDYLVKLKQSQYLNKVPKFVLIDDGVRSGKELLAATIKREHIATLVGSRTAGAFLGASPFRLFDNKYFLYVAVVAGVIPEIGPLEGVGVEPDIAISPCRVFCAGQDPQLNAAMNLIQNNFVTATATVSTIAMQGSWYLWKHMVDGKPTDSTRCSRDVQGSWQQVAGPFRDARCEVAGHPG